MENSAPITPQGYSNLKQELKKLISQDRMQVIKDIEEARAHGDLKENAEYHAAKEKQSMIEARIQKLNFSIAIAEVIDPKKVVSERIVFGATVVYEDTESGEQATWKIVGEEESDIANHRISLKSPIARALLGKSEADIVQINIPKGSLEVEIIQIKYI